MDYYLAGYFLVEGLSRPPQIATFLPTTLWSISSCLCTTYPDTWALSWVTATAVDQKLIQTRLGLTAAGFKTLQAWIDTAFNQQRFGWPNVWLDRASAQYFYDQYLMALPDIKLLAIALPAPYLAMFVNEQAPRAGSGPSGLYQMLLRQQKLADDVQILGFEILGAEYGGACHSFLCNHLENDYQQKLQVRFNEHGLLARYDEAQRAAEFSNLASTGAEPVPWYPWLVVEYPL